jgi:hypothetical protein
MVNVRASPHSSAPWRKLTPLLSSGGVLVQSLRNGELEWAPGFPDLDKTYFQWFQHCCIRLLSVRIPLHIACYRFCAWWTRSGLAVSVRIGTFDVTVNKCHGMRRHVHWKSTDTQSLRPALWLFLLWPIRRPWRWRWHVSPKRRLIWKDYMALFPRIYNFFKHIFPAI